MYGFTLRTFDSGENFRTEGQINPILDMSEIKYNPSLSGIEPCSPKRQPESVTLEELKKRL